MQPARTCAELERIERSRLVDVHRRFVELADGMRQPLPVVIVQPAGAQFVLVQFADRADQAQHELRRGHLHAEHADR